MTEYAELTLRASIPRSPWACPVVARRAPCARQNAAVHSQVVGSEQRAVCQAASGQMLPDLAPERLRVVRRDFNSCRPCGPPISQY